MPRVMVIIICFGVFQVTRQGGSFGMVNITWVIVPTSGTALVNSSGFVLFLSGQLSADVTIDLVNNMKPALDTLYRISLVNVTQVSVFFSLFYISEDL